MRIGIDLGGSKIEVIALDENGATLLRRRVTTPAGDYSAILDSIVELVEHAEREARKTGTVGIACPGAESKRSGLIKNSNTQVLNGTAFRHDISRMLEREVRIENDANCFTLSEAIDGAARDANLVFGAILGTGVGGGIVLNKKILSGQNRIAGEWGHNPLPWARCSDLAHEACYCGRTGCIEYFLSGQGLARGYGRTAAGNLTAQEIAAMADAGNSDARACIQIYKDRLARSLAAVINVLDPDIVVLGGGLSNIAELYSDLPAMVGQYAFSDLIDTPVVPPLHGDSSGVRGAAWLWHDDT